MSILSQLRIAKSAYHAALKQAVLELTLDQCNPESFKQLFSELAHQSGKPDTEIARMLGCSNTTVMRWINGSSTPPKHSRMMILRAIAQYL